MDDLVAFLRARLDEDEQRAREALAPGVFRWVDIQSDLEWIITQTEGDFAEALPKRILAEAAAKRAILAAAEPRSDLRGPEWHIALGIAVAAIASVYSDHPDYRPEWAPAS